MNSEKMTMSEICRAGIEALLDRLGPAGTIRFLQQYDAGHGDYTRERHTWLEGLTVDDIATDIRRRRGREHAE